MRKTKNIAADAYVDKFFVWTRRISHPDDHERKYKHFKFRPQDYDPER